MRSGVDVERYFKFLCTLTVIGVVCPKGIKHRVKRQESSYFLTPQDHNLHTSDGVDVKDAVGIVDGLRDLFEFLSQSADSNERDTSAAKLSRRRGPRVASSVRHWLGGDTVLGSDTNIGVNTNKNGQSGYGASLRKRSRLFGFLSRNTEAAVELDDELRPSDLFHRESISSVGNAPLGTRETDTHVDPDKGEFRLTHRSSLPFAYQGNSNIDFKWFPDAAARKVQKVIVEELVEGSGESALEFRELGNENSERKEDSGEYDYYEDYAEAKRKRQSFTILDVDSQHNLFGGAVEGGVNLGGALEEGRNPSIHWGGRFGLARNLLGGGQNNKAKLDFDKQELTYNQNGGFDGIFNRFTNFNFRWGKPIHKERPL